MREKSHKKINLKILLYKDLKQDICESHEGKISCTKIILNTDLKHEIVNHMNNKIQCWIVNKLRRFPQFIQTSSGSTYKKIQFLLIDAYYIMELNNNKDNLTNTFIQLGIWNKIIVDHVREKSHVKK